jgi:protein O-mannosyl-transferase
VSRLNFLGQLPTKPWARLVIPGTLIALLVFLVYLPALLGDFVWDDDSWTTGLSALFQNTSGLHSIWFQPTALQQYYPLTGTTFWLDYQLWEFWTLPYHVENVLLHTLAALLFWRLLLRLQLPGAWLAAALFALHPVMVESAAWITERKNVLSLVFYLGALLVYERHVQKSEVGNQVSGFRFLTCGFYPLAFVLFLCALLAKTTAFSLPAVILLLGWWQRGRLRWRADVLPTLPFFVLALGFCALTAWLEKHHVGAQGLDFTLTFPQRCLIAGRAFWFYLGKLFWPVNLCFVYPRWQTNPAVWWQWLYPLTAVGILFGLWLARGRIGRGPITALLFFVGTLFPVLGFMNAYGMRYSFVWDHWVYLSALGIITLVVVATVRAAERRRMSAMIYGFTAIVLPGLALLTWRQAGMYKDMETLWRTTLARNPDCWMAHNNLGLLLKTQGHLEEAIEHYLKAIQVNPNDSETLNNLGATFADEGQLDEAIKYYRQAILIKPNYFDAQYNLGTALFQKGQVDEAIENYYQVIQSKPNYYLALYNLGNALFAKGRLDEAIQNYHKAIQINSNYCEAWNNLGFAFAAQGRFDEAIADYRQAILINPNYCDAPNNLGIALVAKGRFDEAIENFNKAILINPDYCDALDNLGNALATQGRFNEAIENYRRAIQANSNHAETFFHLGMVFGQLGRTREAVAQYREALRLNPHLVGALNNLAWVLAASSDDELRNGPEAVRLAEHACELTQYREPLLIGTLAAAYAEAGRFPEAVATAEKAEQLATAAGQTAVAAKNRQLLELYRAGKTYHEPPSEKPASSPPTSATTPSSSIQTPPAHEPGSAGVSPASRVENEPKELAGETPALPGRALRFSGSTRVTTFRRNYSARNRNEIKPDRPAAIRLRDLSV